MKKLINTVLFASLILFSCEQEEFLDKKPHTPTDYAFYTTESGALQGLNAAYDILQQGEQVERHDFVGTVCSGDALTGGEPGGNDQPALQELMKFTALVTNTYAANHWSTMYRGIYRCNLLLTYLKEPLAGFDETLRNRILGEATFLRGFFHYRLMLKYGGFPQMQAAFNNQLKGVPFVDHILLQEEWNQERPELTYTWSRIEQDFIDAAALLKPRSEAYASPENVGRATQGSALAYLAKTYLFQEKWDLAYSTAKQVIESGEYYLEGEDGHTGPYYITRLAKEGEVTVQVPGYKWIWQPEANSCPENLFDVQHYSDHISTFPQGQEGNLMPRYYGPRNIKTWQYSADQEKDVLTTLNYFWGFILPTKFFISTAYRDIGCMEGDKILDPRFEIAVVEPTDSFPYYYADAAMRAKYPDSVAFDPYFNNPATGYCTWKYFTDPYFLQDATTLGDYPQNTKLFRYADLLLIGAEAAVNLGGHDADALQWINRVRNRARNAGNTGYPKALPSVTKEQIWAERRVELAFENHQFYDIIRTGRAKQVIQEEAMLYQTTVNVREGVETTVTEQFGDNFILGQHELWPIPQAEIDATNGSITQNPGYSQ